MRYGYWLPMFGGWLRNVEQENMEASWRYVKQLAQRLTPVTVGALACVLPPLRKGLLVLVFLMMISRSFSRAGTNPAPVTQGGRE
jgi:hypothetical protein